MKALLDTNIIIHREAVKILNQDVGILFRWLDRVKYIKCIHPVTIKEIQKNPNPDTVKTFMAKIGSYEQIEIPTPMQEPVVMLSKQIDINENDINDSILINEVFSGRVDILITEDKKMHLKAEKLGISNRVFNIDGFLEKIFSEHPDLIDYKVLNVQKKKFGNINLQDDFFISLKEDYPGFDKWFLRKTDDVAYITLNKDNGLMLSFLYLKVETADENYHDITPAFQPKKRLKVGTFKVINNGFRLGERFVKIIFDNALANKVDEIYVTIFNHREEQLRLIELMKQWGFRLWGTKGQESVYVRDFSHKFDLDNLKCSYPFVSEQRGIFIVPIYPEYHTELLPDSILNNESPADFIEDFPHRNAINKVYVSWALEPHPEPGDLIIFYRTGGIFKSVVTTVGLVQDVVYNFKDTEDFIAQCRKASVFPEPELIKMWNYRPNKKPFIVRFLYVYSFPHRINMKNLIDIGILQSVDDAPRGFKPITSVQFNAILHNTQSDKSFIID